MRESNLDDEELEEIKDMPIVHGCYFDPWTKNMKCDPDLLKVVVDPTWTPYESELEAKALWAERFFQLSSKGMFSSDVMERNNTYKPISIGSRGKIQPLSTVKLQVARSCLPSQAPRIGTVIQLLPKLKQKENSKA